jgi:hypothetical protein
MDAQVYDSRALSEARSSEREECRTGRSVGGETVQRCVPEIWGASYLQGFRVTGLLFIALIVAVPCRQHLYEADE